MAYWNHLLIFYLIILELCLFIIFRVLKVFIFIPRYVVSQDHLTVQILILLICFFIWSKNADFLEEVIFVLMYLACIDIFPNPILSKSKSMSSSLDGTTWNYCYGSSAAAHGTSAHCWPRLAERALFTFWCLRSSGAPSPASIGPSTTQATGLTLWETQAENFGSVHSVHFCQHAEPLVREPLWCSPAKLWEQGHPKS